MFNHSPKLCHDKFIQTALPVGVSRLMPSLCGISPLTCTIFDPICFCVILRKHISHIFSTSLKSFIMGKLPRLRSYNGTQGRHRLSQGQEKVALCAGNVNLCIITVFSLFLVYGIKPNLPQNR